MSRLAPVAAAALALACFSSSTLQLPTESVPVPEEDALALRQRIETFYTRLLRRRFNTLDTFNDPVLREHFRSVDLFFDYYANLAEALADAHFEKSRPVSFSVQGLAFETRERALVQIQIVGDDGRPLRPGRSALVRVDRWERADGSWWLLPGKL